MQNPKELTRTDIIQAARTFRWRRKMPKWTAVIEGRELPARPLVLEAAGVPPNDSTNSHQAVDILKRLGFETRYNREQPGGRGESRKQEVPHTPGGLSSVLEVVSAATKQAPESAWERVPRDLGKNVDHYLYGAKKAEK